MLKELKYKNDVIPGYFIDQNGKIYDSNGVEQEQHICSSSPYYFFKSCEVHKLMAHSFYGYKEQYVIHHKNQVKTDNRLQNLVYLTNSEHVRLHKIGKKLKPLSEQTKAKLSAVRKGKTGYWKGKTGPMKGKNHSESTKEKISDTKKKKPVFCVELNKIFAGVNIAAKELSLVHSNIIMCCKGKLKTTGGYHFEYYTGEQK